MKKTLLSFALVATMLAFQNEAEAQSNTVKNKRTSAVSSEKANIEKLIYSYQDALNASDADKVVGLYTNDGVLIANAAPTAEGAEQVKGTYQYVFNNFTYNLKFTILEVQVNGDSAYARSTSKGNFVTKANGQTIADENRELFVFQKVNGQWKIARYMYNKSK